MTAKERKALIRILKKCTGIFVSAGGYPKLKDQPYILITEATRDKIVAALEQK